MKILCRCLVALLLMVCLPTLYADENVDQKLDAILKEVSRLNERVRTLEHQVARLTAEMRAAERQQRTTRNSLPFTPKPDIEPLQKLKRAHDVESTIRLQQESPGELLKNIHERERQLRKRPFPADVIPY